MTTTRFGATPRFVAGQVLSANAHLNALQQVVQGLADDYNGISLPFHGNPWSTEQLWTTHWKGIIRHKKNSVSYSYTNVTGTGATYITINGNTVSGSSHTGIGTYTGTNVSIAAMGLTVDAFYEVAVVSACDFKLNYIYEVDTAGTGVTLINFNDEVTPTAAQWQDLSDYADALVARANPPCHLIMRTGDTGMGKHGGAGNQLNGILHHRARYLAYCFYMYPPATKQPDNDRYVEACVTINAVQVLRIRCGLPSIAEDECNKYTYEPNFVLGYVDLDGHGWGFTVGSDYAITVESNLECGSGELFAGYSTYYLYEYADIASTLSGLTAMAEWTHGALIYGSTSSPKVDTIRANLELLDGLIKYRNYPTIQNDNYDVYANRGHSGVRRRRFLHYRIIGEVNPAITDPANESYANGYMTEKPGALRFYVNYKEFTTSLSNPYQTWVALDLESVDGLEVGMQYYVDGCRYCVEDDNP